MFLDFSPDLVILAFCPGNDLADNSKQISAQVDRGFSPFYVLRDGNLVLDNSFRDFNLGYLRQRFLLGAFITRECWRWSTRATHYRCPAFSAAAGKIVPTRTLRRGVPGAKDRIWKEGWSVTEAILAEMNKEVLRAGARFVLVTLTTPIQVDPDVGKRLAFQRTLGVSDLFYTERRLRRLGHDLGFPVITLAEKLQEAASQTGVYFHGFPNTGLGTGHWNTRGHEVVADILARELPHSLKPGDISRIPSTEKRWKRSSGRKPPHA